MRAMRFVAHRENQPYFTVEAIDWLISIKIKMLAQENLKFSPPDTPYGAGLVRNMHQITKPRVFFIALPLRMRRVTATWARAIALEEKD